MAMTKKWWLLAIGLSLPAVAASKSGGGPPPGELAAGALSFLVSKRCEASGNPARRQAEPSLEWPALTYGPGRPPKWGQKLSGPCGGLDTWVMSEALTAGAYWGQNDHAAIEASPNDSLFDIAKTGAAFKKMFGWELPERGDYVPPANVFLKFEGKKLQAIFDRFYVKPGDQVGPATGQQVYDVLLKDFVTRFAREVALVNAKVSKSQLAKMTKAYQAAAKEGGATKFQGPAYLKQVAADALPKDDPLAARAGRTLGVVMRRTMDGTWPTVDRMLKRVVADYDPALAKELGKNL